MEKSMLFWIVYLICVIFGIWCDWPADGKFRALGGRLVIFILLGLLGWQVFGPPIK